MFVTWFAPVLDFIRFHLGIYLNQYTLNLWDKLSRPFTENVEKTFAFPSKWRIGITSIAVLVPGVVLWVLDTFLSTAPSLSTFPYLGHNVTILKVTLSRFCFFSSYHASCVMNWLKKSEVLLTRASQFETCPMTLFEFSSYTFYIIVVNVWHQLFFADQVHGGRIYPCDCRQYRFYVGSLFSLLLRVSSSFVTKDMHDTFL